MSDYYINKYTEKIKHATKPYFNQSLIKDIINQIYEDGFQDGQDKAQEE